MRSAVLGFTLVLSLIFVVAWLDSPPTPAQAQAPYAAMPSGSLISHSTNTAAGMQQVVLIDPQTRVMGVYHVDGLTGKISLKSVRNLHWDLLLEAHNSTNPSPSEIKASLGRP
ncbi:hypothetical protein LOC68_25400 [Blastopirellula sp. JC732]|uniref:Uncharacterized protein n=1 Tax=Blastopirellula sediminis TaxID=2894196 RepID=A0A9X1MRX1_9BACT|nr:hypothetical protein [Blastopirellula sediminis]MCC9604954.1 hypothetical protein [Blastopirellula sediminis]MCC9631746.1 hypothetical protein [Blastopirellula sediminis]